MKKSFRTNKNDLRIPWVESPFFYDLLNSLDISEEQKKMAINFHENGYIILDLELSNDFINKINSDVISSLERDNVKFQSDFYTYNESPRIFEEWRYSENIRNLCLNSKLIKVLEFLYDKEAFPFSTINFIKGSNQPLHSDTIHFHTIPHLWMSGVWVALEDTTIKNGTLNIVPKSHKWPIFDYQNLGLPNPDDYDNGEKINYKIYEQFISEMVKSKNAEILPVSLKKGQCLIWAANLLHGGMEILDKSLTRKTVAIHYFYKDCDTYYHPMFSNVYKGEYAKKWCDEKNNIKTYIK